MAPSRPNVLIIMADQLAASWLPAYGHQVVHAPHLTALAESSTLYESAYCASPLCAPSRSAMLAAALPSRTGVYDNAAEMRAALPTVTHRLRARGYFTGLAGKMHFVGPDQLHGFEERLTTDVYPADVSWTPDWRLGVSSRLPWYHTMESVVTPGVSVASMQQDYDDEVAFRARRKVFDLAREGPNRPFFFVVSFTSPHDPWEIRPRYWDFYDPEAIDLPAVGRMALADTDPHSRRLREMCGTDEVELTPGHVRRARHGYYAAISYLDERVGEVLGALRDAGLEDDTIVLFTADHGEMLGERGLWYKMSFFEAAARVPLLVRVPRHAGARVTEPVSQLDIAPTLLALTGEPGDDLQGALLPGLPTLEPRPRKEPVVGEYLAEGVTEPMVMIRHGRHKLVVCPGDPDQLYDLERDPGELDNLAADPAHADVHASLCAEVERRWDLKELREQVLESQRERRLVARALAEGAHTSWDYVPPGDSSARYIRGRADLYALQRRARLDVHLDRSGEG